MTQATSVREPSLVPNVGCRKRPYIGLLIPAQNLVRNPIDPVAWSSCRGGCLFWGEGVDDGGDQVDGKSGAEDAVDDEQGAGLIEVSGQGGEQPEDSCGDAHRDGGAGLRPSSAGQAERVRRGGEHQGSQQLGGQYPPMLGNERERGDGGALGPLGGDQQDADNRPEQ